MSELSVGIHAPRTRLMAAPEIDLRQFVPVRSIECVFFSAKRPSETVRWVTRTNGGDAGRCIRRSGPDGRRARCQRGIIVLITFRKSTGPRAMARTLVPSVLAANSTGPRVTNISRPSGLHRRNVFHQLHE